MYFKYYSSVVSVCRYWELSYLHLRTQKSLSHGSSEVLQCLSPLQVPLLRDQQHLKNDQSAATSTSHCLLSAGDQDAQIWLKHGNDAACHKSLWAWHRMWSALLLASVWGQHIPLFSHSSHLFLPLHCPLKCVGTAAWVAMYWTEPGNWWSWKFVFSTSFSFSFVFFLVFFFCFCFFYVTYIYTPVLYPTF